MDQTKAGQGVSMLGRALDYAKRGLAVFPCHPAPPRAKQPLTAHGVKDATRDEATIRGWWQRWPDAMIGAAILFAERHRGQLRFCHAHGAWFEWDGAIWRRNGTCRAFHYARELARKMAEDEPDKVKKVASKAAFAGAVEKFARADPVFAVTADVWDQNPMLLGTPGGTVDLHTGELRPARAEDGITRSTSTTPADVVDCPLWRKFLDETFAGDQALIAFAQRWAGYCLTGLTREHSLVFGYGEGGNGKSVFVNALAGILADYAVTAAMDTFIASHGDKHSTDLAMLRGARLVTASETEEGRQWAESRVKAMTGGDPVTARFMRQDTLGAMGSNGTGDTFGGDNKDLWMSLIAAGGGMMSGGSMSAGQAEKRDHAALLRAAGA